jgi:hypothetical protein
LFTFNKVSSFEFERHVFNHFELSLKDSQVLLANISKESSKWLKTCLSNSNEETLLNVNKMYLKVLGELKGKSFLIDEVIKKK